MANEMIRTSEVVAATEITVCEICGHTGLFEDFLWCNPCNVVHCTHNHDCIEAHINCVQNPVVPCITCGTEKPASQMLKHDGNFCCVTEGCYMPLMEKESIKMSEFTMEGFNHISAEGVVEFWQLLQTQGTIDLLWDMQPKTKINALMQSANFDMDAHIKTNYCDHDSKVYNYDDICADMLDEMLETIITLEYCFIYDVYNIDFKGRSFKNLDAIPESAVWSPNVYLPLLGERVFTDQGEMEKFVMDYFTMETTDYNLIVTITAIPADDSDYDTEQSIPFKVTGACEFNLMIDLCNILEGEAYTLTFTCNK